MSWGHPVSGQFLAGGFKSSGQMQPALTAFPQVRAGFLCSGLEGSCSREQVSDAKNAMVDCFNGYGPRRWKVDHGETGPKAEATLAFVQTPATIQHDARSEELSRTAGPASMTTAAQCWHLRAGGLVSKGVQCLCQVVA